MQARCMHIKSSPQGLYGCLNLVKGCNKLAKRDSDNLLPWLSLACHFYLHGCACAYVCMCVHVHIVNSYRYLNEPETDRPLKKKKTLMWWTTHPAAYTRCCSGSQIPCYYFSLIGTIRACFLNHKEHTAEKKMVDFALPSSPSLIFTTKSCNFSRLMSPFVSHKFPVIVFQLHHKRSI